VETNSDRPIAATFLTSRTVGRRQGRVLITLIMGCAAAYVVWWTQSADSGRITAQAGDRAKAPATVAVDRGDVALTATESGTVESADDNVVRCRVESFLGLPTVAIAQQKSAVPQQGKIVKLVLANVSGKAADKKSSSSGRSSRERSSASTSAQPTRGSSGGANSASTAGSAANSSARPSSDAQAAAESAPVPRQPTIRSFVYAVEPHTPLRLSIDAPIPAVGPPPPPTTILSIVPEGSRMPAGGVVCQLDSAAFRDELRVQQIRCLQAKAWVEQARSLLEASEIALREYEGGIFPQDLELLRHHAQTCEINRERCRRNLAWSRSVAVKGYRTPAQLKADTLTLQDAEIAVEGAQDMLDRLIKFTRTRILKARGAKIEAIRADMLSLETSYQIERQRLRRIETMIANCTLRAPRAGIILYANRTNGWGQVESRIFAGQTVYESQPIFRMLDPLSMRIRARINQTQIALIKPGLRAHIQLDAFPDRPLTGTVQEVTPIPELSNGPFSDVLSYFANVAIDSGGFGELRPGLSAEVVFEVETRREVPRVPIEAIRWTAGKSFAAVAGTDETEPAWEWKPVTLGISDTTFAEVISGLEPGDEVVTDPDDLPAPSLDHSPASDLESRTLLARELR
jgi:HlyD family secretion protein